LRSTLQPAVFPGSSAGQRRHGCLHDKSSFSAIYNEKAIKVLVKNTGLFGFVSYFVLAFELGFVSQKPLAFSA
jgi:hypothetical protein